jgi:hypothetical protein
VEPSTVEARKLAGWHVIGTAELDSDGNVVQTGKVIETPAHTIVTTDGFLKILPVYVAPAEQVVPPVVKAEAAKPKK